MNETNFLNTDWMETQRKYWQAWTDMGLNAMGQKNSEASPSPWENALDNWWQALAPTAPDASKDFLNKLMDHGKLFLRMSDDLYRNMGAGNNPLNGLQGQSDEAMRRMMSIWELPLNNWQKTISSLSLSPSDALRNMLPQEQMQEQLQRILGMPGFGYAREEQGQYQELMRYGLQYQNALNDYTQFFSSLGTKSMERMRTKLDKLNSDKQIIDSGRKLYDLWVNCCEEVYAEQVITPEYGLLHGKLINTLMAFKQQMSAMVDKNLGAMNMPTKAELRTLQDRLQETRRENKHLRKDIEALRDLVAALDAGVTPAPTVALAAEASRQAAASEQKSTASKTI